MTSATDAGKGELAHDTKYSNLWNSAVALLVLAGVEFLAGVDWSAWPTWVGTIGAPLTGLAIGWLRGKALPRFKR
jgi:hypothetical protein